MTKLFLILLTFLSSNDLVSKEAEILIAIKEADLQIAEITKEKCLLFEKHLLVELGRMRRAKQAFPAAEIDDKLYEYENAKLDRKISEINIVKKEKELLILRLKLDMDKQKNNNNTSLD